MPIETVKKRRGLEHVVRGVPGFDGTRFTETTQEHVTLQEARGQPSRISRTLQSLQQHIAYMLAAWYDESTFLTCTIALYYRKESPPVLDRRALLAEHTRKRPVEQYFVAFYEDQFNFLASGHLMENGSVVFNNSLSIAEAIETAERSGRVVNLDGLDTKTLELSTESRGGRSEFGMNPFAKATAGCLAEPFAQLRYQNLRRKGYIHVLPLTEYAAEGLVEARIVAMQDGEIYVDAPCTFKGYARRIFKAPNFKMQV